jgi:hypothetical protein
MTFGGFTSVATGMSEVEQDKFFFKFVEGFVKSESDFQGRQISAGSR